MRNRPRNRLVLVMVGVVMIAGCSGHSSSSGRGDRVIDVTMSDNRFTPNDYAVRKGETVTFRLTNTGTATHEAFIGPQAEQDEHHGEMTTRGSMRPAGSATTATSAGGAHSHGASQPDDHSHGGGTNEVSVDPGKTGELTYTFNDSGTVIIGCHEPGHWESGMRAPVLVA